ELSTASGTSVVRRQEYELVSEKAAFTLLRGNHGRGSDRSEAAEVGLAHRASRGRSLVCVRRRVLRVCPRAAEPRIVVQRAQFVHSPGCRSTAAVARSLSVQQASSSKSTSLAP